MSADPPAPGDPKPEREREREPESESEGEEAPESERAPPPARSWVRRLTPLLLAGAGLLVFRHFSELSPDEREIVLELQDAGAVTAVELEWVRVKNDAPEADAEAGQSLRFEPGQAPKTVPLRVKLHDGIYEVRSRIESNAKTRENAQRIDVSKARRITLPLR